MAETFRRRRGLARGARVLVIHRAWTRRGPRRMPRCSPVGSAGDRDEIAELPPFAPMVESARAGRLDRWLTHPTGRLSLILLLDQFSRGLFAGTPEAYAADPLALRIAQEGIRPVTTTP